MRSYLILTFLFILEASCYIVLPFHKHISRTPQLKMSSGISLDMNINDENLPYLEKLEKEKKQRIQKLQSVRDNIGKFLDSSVKNDTTVTKVPYIKNPIMQTDFDKLFLNLNNVQQIFISNDYDRAVFCMFNGQRLVYFINNKNDKELMEKIINVIKHPVKIIVVCDKTLFTDKFKFLYCGS